MDGCDGCGPAAVVAHQELSEYGCDTGALECKEGLSAGEEGD